MLFDIYGRFQLEILREHDAWAVYRLDHGKRRRTADLIVPASVAAAQIPTYLDDILHELASPGAAIRRVK